ncbi:PIG-L family deacetylase [Streptomyces sp. SL13]|uniref:PIG-L family deacetylase n=1 Tax=Streptantibioticus silvisoli TaxID=2705255 RepID=A0AA90GZR4_9ACTN|nr:PIG-L family deacetylase [Streptantibioticus silvisoli]MDI5963411.1 PIG-L family deacetylase [Streptantibioticus silvisoli]MDI5967810.1 PIG-L family deacetylase [Streptantibioticus silvisoli]
MTPPPRDPIQAPGTPEEVWRAWPVLAGLPAFELPAAGRVVVVAAHPDDEVLGFGGAMAELADRGVDLRLVAVTDGEASHPAGHPLAAGLAGRRTAETGHALAALGATAAVTVTRLALPDTGVAAHEEELVRLLTPLLEGAALCAAPWTGDVHADHEAAGRAAVEAARAAAVPLVQYPVWMWHWAAPQDERVPWHRACRLPLSPALRERKRAAVDCFTSQTEPLGDGPGEDAVLPPGELAHHLRPWEVVFR